MDALFNDIKVFIFADFEILVTGHPEHDANFDAS